MAHKFSRKAACVEIFGTKIPPQNDQHVVGIIFGGRCWGITDPYSDPLTVQFLVRRIS